MPLSVYMHAIQPMIYHLMQKWFPWKQAPTLKIDHLMHSKVPWQVWHHMKAQRSSRSHPFHQNSIRQMFPEINTQLLLRLQTFWCSELLHLTENSIHFKRLNKHSHFYAGHIEASIMLLRHTRRIHTDTLVKLKIKDITTQTTRFLVICMIQFQKTWFVQRTSLNNPGYV